jgi:phosphoadenosine phosphosulfate reductase
VQDTIGFISDVLSKHSKPYVAYSTGKDSLVMLDLCKKINPSIDIMFHDSRIELPESYELIEKAEKYYNKKINIVGTPKDILEIYKDKKAFFGMGDHDYAWTPCMLKPIMEWSKKTKKDVAFIGLRKQESAKRRMMLGRHGNYFYAKTRGIHQCFPLAAWTVNDVFAYIFSNELDHLLHPAYYKDQFRKAERIRVSWYCDPTAGANGYFVWLKYYYPELFRKLCAKFPEVASYA